ncbi:MAG: lytic transglycosylase domain-containing protein [Oscillospiraceae bacterium]|jgi:soluble lytic murein transglycosylase-like protein|nr:lytic transglycosylase domain-containing protein [Oscillospiraceae bacterium]
MVTRIDGGLQQSFKAEDGKTEVSGFSDALNQSRNQSLDEIFKEASTIYNVPLNLLKAVAKTESGFDPNAVSRSGAQGIMQLMPATAKGLGVDDPFDAEQNIMGGARMLEQLLSQYNGDVTLTLAAYNAGAGNVAKYGGVPPFAETQAFIERVKSYAGGDITVPSTYISDGNTKSVDYTDDLIPSFLSKLLELEQKNDDDDEKTIW